MPELLTVSDSSEEDEDTDESDSDEDEDDSDDEYDSEDDENIRQLLREAMDLASMNPELVEAVEEPPEAKKNSFLRALRSYMGTCC